MAAQSAVSCPSDKQLNNYIFILDFLKIIIKNVISLAFKYFLRLCLTCLILFHVFERLEVIQRSKGLEPENIGVPIWKLALCMLLSWIIVVACLYKGVKSSGKVGTSA